MKGKSPSVYSSGTANRTTVLSPRGCMSLKFHLHGIELSSEVSMKTAVHPPNGVENVRTCTPPCDIVERCDHHRRDTSWGLPEKIRVVTLFKSADVGRSIFIVCQRDKSCKLYFSSALSLWGLLRWTTFSLLQVGSLYVIGGIIEANLLDIYVFTNQHHLMADYFSCLVSFWCSIYLVCFTTEGIFDWFRVAKL